MATTSSSGETIINQTIISSSPESGQFIEKTPNIQQTTLTIDTTVNDFNCDPNHLEINDNTILINNNCLVLEFPATIIV